MCWMVAFSSESPQCSAQLVLTEGAICTIVVTSGSARASYTRMTSSRSRRAPVGQCVMHWPHSVQSTSWMFAPPATSTRVWVARFVMPQMWDACTLSQIWMQRMHRMHLSLLRMSGKSCGHGVFARMLLYGESMIPRSFETSASLQLPPLAHVVHVVSCCASRSITFSRRARRTFGLFVLMLMPSST